MTHQPSTINHQPSAVLITGGAGFIGSHLCDEYLKKDFTVLCVDNLITGQEKNIKHLIKHPSFKFIKADVANLSSYRQIHSLITNPPTGGPLLITNILHFASPAGPNPNSPKSYLKYPIETYLVNSIGTHYLLELAKKYQAEFLFASTSEVYGDPLEHPQKETYFGNVNTLGPRSCYDESKRFGEMATITYGKRYHLKTKIVRIFNTYGPRMNPLDGRVMPQFITQALQNQNITIYGNGKQTRSFCYIDDLINGITLILEKGKTWETYNLGNDEEISINELAAMIIKTTGSTSSVTFKELPVDDPERRKPDLSKIKSELGWQPTTSLENGLHKTINYFKQV